ncbi:MAG TPA: hypothetical protein VIV12_11370 [Streptosporangiaceae bacterium]
MSQWFQLAVAAIGIVGVVTGAAVYTRSRLSFELLRGDLTDARAREADLRQVIADLRERAAHADGENAQLKQRVTMLEDLVTRAPDIAALAAKMDEIGSTVRLLMSEKVNHGQSAK